MTWILISGSYIDFNFIYEYSKSKLDNVNLEYGQRLLCIQVTIFFIILKNFKKKIQKKRRLYNWHSQLSKLQLYFFTKREIMLLYWILSLKSQTDGTPKYYTQGLSFVLENLLQKTFLKEMLNVMKNKYLYNLFCIFKNNFIYLEFYKNGIL